MSQMFKGNPMMVSKVPVLKRTMKPAERLATVLLSLERTAHSVQ